MRLPGDQTLALGAKCLHVLIAELTEEGVPPADLQPLVDLEAFLQMLKAQAQGEGGANRRKRRPPSQTLLARTSALIDLLIKAGYDESNRHALVDRRRRSAAAVRWRRARLEAAAGVADRLYAWHRVRRGAGRIRRLHARDRRDPGQ
jgi:hypothetical protein